MGPDYWWPRRYPGILRPLQPFMGLFDARGVVSALDLLGLKAHLVARLQGRQLGGVLHAEHHGHGRHVEVLELAMAQRDFEGGCVHPGDLAFAQVGLLLVRRQRCDALCRLSAAGAWANAGRR